MENLFNNIPTGGEAEIAPAAKTAASNEKSAKIQMMKDALRETISADPTFEERVRTLSNSVIVVNSLGFGESGNIIVDKTKTEADKRTLASTSMIVGYRVQNVGDTPIKYVTEVWTQGEDGKYVASKAEKVMAPGESADLTRQYMTMFCSKPEISFQLGNGKIIKGSGSRNNKGGIKAELESFYFSFNKDANGEKRQINDDDVKLNVGEKVGDKWVVKAEYVETFGYLNNPKEKTGRTGRGSASKWNAQDVAANYIQTLLKKEGM